MRSLPVLILGAAALVACTKAPSPTAGDAEVETAPEPPPRAQDATPKPPPLSAEDVRLIEADPKDLTPDERRKRAYALRRKIMQNPDSPAARTLSDLADAARNGELGPGQTPTMHLPGTEPTAGRPPAGVRPQDARRSDDEAERAPPAADAR